MYQPIGEEISVAGVFARGQFQPTKFRWQNQVYPIKEVTFTAQVRDGGVIYRFFSVLSGGNLYRLRFEPLAQHWQLQEIWCEG